MTAWTWALIVNEALRAIGYTKRISEPYDGSRAAKAALEVYSQTRDFLLRSGQYPFSRGETILTLLKGPPPVGAYNIATPWTAAQPLGDWLYEYQYPSDCIEARAVTGLTYGLPVMAPQPVTFTEGNDTINNVNQKVLLTNKAAAKLIYCRRVTDPNQWEAGYLETFIAALGAKLAVPLGMPDMKKDQAAEAVATEGRAYTERG